MVKIPRSRPADPPPLVDESWNVDDWAPPLTTDRLLAACAIPARYQDSSDVVYWREHNRVSLSKENRVCRSLLASRTCSPGCRVVE